MSVHKDKRGRWRYRFAYRGKRYSGSAPRGANTRAAALKLERDHLDRLMRNEYTGVMPTVSEFIDRVLEHQKARVKPLTYRNQENIFRLHIKPHIGKLALDRVGAKHLADLVTSWTKIGKPRSVNTWIMSLVRMFSLAVEWGMIPKAPSVSSVKVPHDTPRFLSSDEAVKLLAAAEDWQRFEWRSMIIVGLRTGLRIGELRGLQWADVDLSRGVLYVRRTDPGMPAYDPNDPKGGRGRVIPLSPDAIACLRWLKETDEAARGVLPSGTWVWRGARNGHDLTQTRSQGACSDAIERYAEAAGLDDVGWHTLRHTFASWLVIRGIPLRVVQELLGHSSIKQTERYAHLSPGAVNHAVVASLDMPFLEGAPSLPPLPPGDDDADD